MWWSLVNASQFARKAFSCFYMGLIVVRINIRNEMMSSIDSIRKSMNFQSHSDSFSSKTHRLSHTDTHFSLSVDGREWEVTKDRNYFWGPSGHIK